MKADAIYKKVQGILDMRKESPRRRRRGDSFYEGSHLNE
jgi:hypothetical protein